MLFSAADGIVAIVAIATVQSSILIRKFSKMRFLLNLYASLFVSCVDSEERPARGSHGKVPVSTDL